MVPPPVLHQPQADDLDDGLEYDVQYSDDNGETEVNEAKAVGEVGEADSFQAGTLNSGNIDKSEDEEPRKRKRDSSKLKEKKKQKMEMDTEKKRNIAMENSTELIAEFINSKITKKNTQLSALELSELYFSKNDIRTISEFTKPRTLDNLSEYINLRFKNMLPSKSGKSKKQARNLQEQDNEKLSDRKFIAIVSMSAIRACDVYRATRDLNGGSIKLINKNKLQVDLKLVESTRSRVLCCTPGRLIKVLNNEDSKLRKDEIKIIIVDNSYLDQKKQNIWDIAETVEVLKELTKKGSKIYLY
ncbi:hypothetical protein KGF56_001438 [Candida oxycetoniae]|uniref:Protein CMS1 n=1 Tax=Candida oxycetoniae TaxID=497107 RepID=A0AAI9WYX8_9ASCO|nr:uncharacterized protein KGF56_001438 [Candida oxycetoniae]KAI3405831.2 hypothetical protein KGF56_001438 [Candida oxycetoniae]